MEMEREEIRREIQKRQGKREAGWQETGQELLARIVVAAGIFLLLFLAGRFLGDPSQETIRSWISSNQSYETMVTDTASWVEQRLEKKEVKK